MFFVCLFVFLKLSRKLSDKEPTLGKEDAKTSTCTQELDIIQLKFLHWFVHVSDERK